MSIDKINGSQTLFNNEIDIKPRAILERSTITLEDKRQIEKAVLKRKDASETISKEKLTETIDKLNGFFEPSRRNLKFEFHDKLDQYYVSVVDSITSEVIKEIPPKKFLDMYAAMAEFMGILVDKKI